MIHWRNYYIPFRKLTWKTWSWRNQNILQKFNNTSSCIYTDILVHEDYMTDTYPWHLHLTVRQGPPDAVVVDPLSPPVLLLSEVLRADTDQGAGLGHFWLNATAFVKVDVCHHLLVLDHLSHHIQLSGWVGLICRVCHYYITVMSCVRVYLLLTEFDMQTTKIMTLQIILLHCTWAKCFKHTTSYQQ